MDYKIKYHKYKALYLNMKTNMNGGENGKTDSDQGLFERIRTTGNIYANKISNLQKSLASTKEKYTDTEEIKSTLKNVYESIGEYTRGYLNISDIFKETEAKMGSIDLKTIRKNIDEKIENKVIPLMEKQKRLYDKFAEQFKDIRLEDIEGYIDFATINGMLEEKSPKEISPKEILEKLSSRLNTEQEKLKKYMKEKFIKEETSSFQKELVASSTSPRLSKNKHKCTSECKIGKSIFGEYHYCETEKYKTLTGEYKWDYCKH